MKKKRLKAAVFAAKFKNNYTPFLEETKRILDKLEIDVDASYFDFTCEEDKENFKGLYRRVEKILVNSDFIIIENTNRSRGISFILGRTLTSKKPAIALLNRNEEHSPSIIIRAYSYYKNYFYQEYTEETYEKVLSRFIKKAKRLLNTKFLLDLEPEYTKYINWATEKYNSSKVDIIRNMINEKIRSNQDYIKFQEDSDQAQADLPTSEYQD